VWAVGGTRLLVNSDGSRANEMAWGDGRPGDDGGGGGYDPSIATPSWQNGIVPSRAKGRGVPDTSANADPQSGWQIPANGSWTVVGGTSAASPFTAALIAVAYSVAAKRKGVSVAEIQKTAGLLLPAIYGARATACNDITTGSDGNPAVSGWDPATGLGTPNGDGFIDAIASFLAC
jgi:kumamolisin